MAALLVLAVRGLLPLGRGSRATQVSRPSDAKYRGESKVFALGSNEFTGGAGYRSVRKISRAVLVSALGALCWRREPARLNGATVTDFETITP
jgi:hypothetical protein